MDDNSYTVRVAASSDVAGLALRVASTTDAQLATHVPSMCVYDADNSLLLRSDKDAKVVMTAVVEPTENTRSRVMIGVRDKKRKVMTIYPAAGDQVATLHPRLSSVKYHGVQTDTVPGSDPSQRQERYQKKSQLVQAFGSTRRVRKMSEGAVTQMLDGNVVSRKDVEAAVQELGQQAEGAGLTTKQVMSQVSAARSIPPHNPEATSAEDAYKSNEVITEQDLQHLHASTILGALQDSNKLQALRASNTWNQLKPVVRFVMQNRRGPGLLDVEAEDCSKWLALLQVCCHVFKLGMQAELDESSSSLVQPVDNAEAEEEDPFAERTRRKLHMGTFSHDGAFLSVDSAKYWLAKFGETTSISGMTVFKISESQRLLLSTTIAVCAIRSNGNKLSTDMVTALLKSLKPKTASEVSTWFKQIGCTTTPVKRANGAEQFSVTLLNARTEKTLAACLPDLNRRKSRQRG